MQRRPCTQEDSRQAAEDDVLEGAAIVNVFALCRCAVECEKEPGTEGHVLRGVLVGKQGMNLKIMKNVGARAKCPGSRHLEIKIFGGSLNRATSNRVQ